MLEKIKKMKVEKKLKYCFALVIFVASISGVLGRVDDFAQRYPI